LNKIIKTAPLTSTTEVLEIGAGVGSLTRLLAQAAKRVTAVEIDSRLIPALTETVSPFSNVKITHGDILTLNPSTLMEQEGFIVVANIPYYITSAIVRHLLEGKLKPAYLVLTIQREVAYRICAQPGEMSLLALSVQVYGKPKVACTIPAGAFYPVPKVDSAVLLVSLNSQPYIVQERLSVFFRLIKIAFAQKRKPCAMLWRQDWDGKPNVFKCF
jgi:16S rRNA (adenine1518-N6/adenine1519-N6)-dimethyltransferase